MRLITPDEDSAASIIISVIITAVLFSAQLGGKNRLTICCLMEPLCYLYAKKNPITTMSTCPAILIVKFESSPVQPLLLESH